MLNERPALRSRRIPEAKRRRIAAVDGDDAFESTAVRRDLVKARNRLRCELAAAGDLQLMTGHGAAQALAGILDDRGGLGKLKALRRCGREHGSRERMFRVALQAGDERQDFARGKPGGDHALGQYRLAVGESAGLVENRGAASGDLLEDDRALDDDRALGAE